MTKLFHEIRDPIHVFVRLTTDERDVLNSRAFQRLRYIHQLALTYLVYPGATHRRFEHSLGVMELATRIFDVVTDPSNINEDVRNLLPEIADDFTKVYWRRVLRIAALCHDVGHLPFSHAAEKELLPSGMTHEHLTRLLVLDDELGAILDGLKTQRLDVVKLALGPRDAPDLTFSTWETILAEIIVGDAFGADRMDYLLRDSHHAGVAYGRFDHFRLIDTLRILPSPPAGSGEASRDNAPASSSSAATEPSNSDAFEEPSLGILDGGLHSAEALMLARFFMFTQLYFHPVRRIYDIHLKDFLVQTLPDGKYASTVNEHLEMTDNEVTVSILKASRDPASPGHDPASRIVTRRHFRVVYTRNPDDINKNPDAASAIYEAAQKEFGEENVRLDQYHGKGETTDFPVELKDNRIISSLSASSVLNDIPVPVFDCVFVAPDLEAKARAWLGKNRASLIQPRQEQT